MNKELIRQLALEAFQPINDIASEGIADRRTFDQAWFQLYNQKFAELIVKECISMADKESDRYSNLDQEYCIMAMDNYRELVRKHFGVEE